MTIPIQHAVGIVVILLCLLTFMIWAWLTAPIFSTTIFACLAMGIGFVATESRGSWEIWHQARESENRFWSLLAMLMSTSILFASDSPFAIGQSYPLTGLCLVFAFCVFVHIYDRKLSRATMNRPSKIRRVRSQVLSDAFRAKVKTQAIESLVKELDYSFVALKALNQSSIQEKQSEIIEILREADTEELNYIVTNVKLALLFYKIKDKDWMAFKNQRKNRTAVLELLCEDRIHELNTVSKVHIIHALQRMRLSAHSNTEEWVRNLFLSTHGKQLISFKCSLDHTGTANNLHQLVWHSVRDPDIRHEILSHIHAEAKTLVHHRPLRKILSDVDDTLFSSGGHFPAGIDTRLGKHVLYPGILTFYKELDLGFEPDGYWDPARKGNLTFLSARPHVYKDKSEKKSYSMFADLHERKEDFGGGQPMHSVATLLAGSLDSGIQMFRGDFEPMARKKWTNFSEYAQLYPEFLFVFVCDNGQGDVRAAELMKDKYGDLIEGVFVHQVQPLHLTPGWDANARERWEEMNITFFKTYIGAALKACEDWLIHPLGLKRTINDALEDYKLRLAPHLSPALKEHWRCSLNRDIEAANILLARNNIDPALLLPAECLYPDASFVSTPFGVGRVCEFRPAADLYKVIFSNWQLAQNELPHAWVRGECLSYYTKGSVGVPVWTPFGTGIIKEVRNKNSIHVISIRHRDQFEMLDLDSFSNSLVSGWSSASRSSFITTASSSNPAASPISVSPYSPLLSPLPFPSSSSSFASSSSLRRPSELPRSHRQTMSAPANRASAPSIYPYSLSSASLSTSTSSDKKSSDRTSSSDRLSRSSIAYTSNKSEKSRRSRSRGRTQQDKKRRKKFEILAYLQPNSIKIIKAAVGQKVQTEYGQGVVELYREHDDTYQVLLMWADSTIARAFLNSSSVTLISDDRKGSRCVLQ